MAHVLGEIAEGLTSGLSAFNTVQQLKLQARKQALLEEIQRGNLDIRQRTIALAELKNIQAQERQEQLLQETTSFPDALRRGGDLDGQITQGLGLGGAPDLPPAQNIDPTSVNLGLDDQLAQQFNQGEQPQTIPGDLAVSDIEGQGTPAPQLRPIPRPFERTPKEIDKINKKLFRLSVLDPTGKSHQNALDSLAFDTLEKTRGFDNAMTKIRQETTSILKNRDNSGAMFRDIQRVIRERTQAGVASPRLEEILLKPSHVERVIGLDQRLAINTNTKELIKIRAKELEQEGKIELEQEKSRFKGGIVLSSQISDKGFIVKENADGTFTTTRVLSEAETSGDTGKFSAVSKIYANGTVIQAGPGGNTLVKDPAGENVTGDARLAVLKEALQADIDIARTTAGAKAAGTAAIGRSEKNFDRVTKLEVSIDNIDNAIKVLDKGAKTGAISSFFPSIKAASVELDNIQKAMGLDVIGTTTFGALSKGELDLALSKALPTRLSPPELKKWLLRKKTAQEKMSIYLKNAAIYLGTPGNTSAGWAEAQAFLQSQNIADPTTGSQTNQATPTNQGTAPVPPANETDAVFTGQRTPDGFPVFRRPNGSTFGVRE